MGFERVAGGFSDAVKLDPAALAAWRDLGARIKGALSALDDPADIANVANAVKTIIEDFNSVAKAVELNQHGPPRRLGRKSSTSPGWRIRSRSFAKARKRSKIIYEKIPGYKALQETKNAPTEAAPIPGLSSIGDAIKRLWEGSQAAPPATFHDRPPLRGLPSSAATRPRRAACLSHSRNLRSSRPCRGRHSARFHIDQATTIRC